MNWGRRYPPLFAIRSRTMRDLHSRALLAQRRFVFGDRFEAGLLLVVGDQVLDSRFVPPAWELALIHWSLLSVIAADLSVIGSRQMKNAGLSFCVIVALLESSCIADGPTLCQSTSPDRKWSVAVIEIPHGPDSSYRIALTNLADRTNKEIFRANGDHGPACEAPSWSADSKELFVRVCDNLAGDYFFGFNVEIRAVIPQDTVQLRFPRDTCVRYP